MSVSSSTPTHLIPIDPRETMNELHSYITSSERGYLTQAELFHYYQQRHENAEIPYRLLGYRSLLDLLSTLFLKKCSDQRLFTIDLHGQTPYIYSTTKLQHSPQHELDPIIHIFPEDQNAYAQLSFCPSNAYHAGGFQNELNSRLLSAAASTLPSIRENSNICHAGSKRTEDFEDDRIDARGNGGGIYATIRGGKKICYSYKGLTKQEKEIPVDRPLVDDVREGQISLN